MTCCRTLKQEKTQKVEELETSIKDMDKDSTKDTAKRKNGDKQAEAKLQGLEQENTKLQEEIFKLTKERLLATKRTRRPASRSRESKTKRSSRNSPAFCS